jgi:hypothetical protein
MDDAAQPVKRGPGRPRLHPPQAHHAMSVRLDPDDLAKVDWVCAHKRMSRSTAIRALLRTGWHLRDTIPVQDRSAALEVGPARPGSGPPQGAATAAA